ncbi:MAG: hypothetical protein AABZ47_08660, partial [Planctomycetota bacterium]
ALLLDADQEFVQEGTHPIRRFPETAEELARFDVILFGDVDPRSGWLTPAQMNLILDAVGNDGAGFGLLAGDRHAPQRFLGTPLEKLLPVRIDPEFTGQYESTLTTGFHPQLTPEGRISGLFRLPTDKDRTSSADESSSSTAEPARLFESLPELFWIARTLGPKAGASVLVQHPSLRVRGDRAMGTDLVPMLVTGRFGAGRLVFQATDETWRWRRHRIGATPAGELLHDTYWVQIARLLAKLQQIDRDRRILLQTDRRSYEFGDRVLVRIEVRSPELLARIGESIHVSFAEAQTATESTDKTQSAPKVLRLEAHRSAPESNRFDAAGVPPKPGRYAVHIDDTTLSATESPPTVLIRVEQPNLESRRPEANHELLQRITEATGGRFLEPDQLESELGAIPDRNVQIPDDVVESLTDAPLPYVLFCVLITVEWVLRRRFGLS